MPFNKRQGAYLLASAYSSFPARSCHLAIFDVFSERIPRLVLCDHNGHYFLSADNGVIPRAIGNGQGRSWLCFEMEKQHTFTDWLHAAGKAIEQLQTRTPEELQLPPYMPKQADPPPVSADGNSIDVTVLHIDRYENVVLDITRRQFDTLRGDRRFRMLFMQTEELTELSVNYNDVREGNKLCRFNSNDHLEICINRGKAASIWGFRMNGQHNDIKIFFE